MAHAHTGLQEELDRAGAGFSQVNDPCQAQEELRDRRQEERGHERGQTLC